MYCTVYSNRLNFRIPASWWGMQFGSLCSQVSFHAADYNIVPNIMLNFLVYKHSITCTLIINDVTNSGF